MEEIMSQFLAENMNVTEEEAAFIAECMPVRTYPKGTVLLRAGQVATECYMNFKGLVRRYYLVDGEERTTAFYTENQAVASLLSYNTKTPADHYLECVEETTLAVLTYEKELLMFQRYPEFERMCRVGVEVQYGQHQEMMARYMTSSPEERYLHLLETSPDLLNRVPQYHLASYLGIKPESLSRIRKRVMQKQ